MTTKATDAIERRTIVLGARVTPTTRAALARILQPGQSLADWIESHALADARKIQRKPGAADPVLWAAVCATCSADVVARIAATWAEKVSE